MDRFDTIARLHRAGIHAFYLFVDPDCARFGLVELLRTGEMPSAEPGRPVYPTTREGLYPLLREEIERAAIGVL